MAKVFNTEEIELQGWETPITVKPLVLAKLREVQKFIKENIKEEDLDEIDFFLRIGAKVMESLEPQLSNPEVLGEHVDMDTLNYIIKATTGVSFAPDPNLIAAMEAAANGTKD